MWTRNFLARCIYNNAHIASINMQILEMKIEAYIFII